MIKRQIEKVSKKVLSQAHKLLGVERRTDGPKRDFIEAYITKVQPAVPDVSREDVAIIVTGFISQLRSLTLDEVSHVVHEIHPQQASTPQMSSKLRDRSGVSGGITDSELV